VEGYSLRQELPNMCAFTPPLLGHVLGAAHKQYGCFRPVDFARGDCVGDTNTVTVCGGFWWRFREPVSEAKTWEVRGSVSC
jgi:hypothetical protein